MTIGFDGSRAFIKNRTGTENYSYQLLKNISKLHQTDNYNIYLRPQNEDVIKKEWPNNFKFQTLDFKLLWTQLGLSLQTFKDGKLDVLFVPAHTLPLIRKPGLKTVVTVHDLGAEYLPQTHQLKQRLYLKLMTDYQLKGATHIIAVSEATKKDIIKRVRIGSDKITVVYEGYDQGLLRKVNKQDKSRVLQKYGLKEDRYFLFVGTVQPRKNLERLIKAFAGLLNKKSGDLKLVIAGSHGWLSDEIFEAPKKMGIEDQVKFLGYVADGDLASLYSGALAFVYPSLFEGFGLPILEAQACNCPVLTSNLSSMPEVAGDSAVLVDPYSVESIEVGMKKFLNSQTREKYRILGHKNISRFSWEKAARETLAVLEKISNQ